MRGPAASKSHGAIRNTVEGLHAGRWSTGAVTPEPIPVVFELHISAYLRIPPISPLLSTISAFLRELGSTPRAASLAVSSSRAWRSLSRPARRRALCASPRGSSSARKQPHKSPFKMQSLIATTIYHSVAQQACMHPHMYMCRNLYAFAVATDPPHPILTQPNPLRQYRDAIEGILSPPILCVQGHTSAEHSGHAHSVAISICASRGKPHVLPISTPTWLPL
jgi:hypothetical protein